MKSPNVETKSALLHCEVCGPYAKHEYKDTTYEKIITDTGAECVVEAHNFQCQCGAVRRWGITSLDKGE